MLSCKFVFQHPRSVSFCIPPHFLYLHTSELYNRVAFTAQWSPSTNGLYLLDGTAVLIGGER